MTAPGYPYASTVLSSAVPKHSCIDVCSKTPSFHEIASSEKPYVGQHTNLGCLLNVITNLIIKGKQLLGVDLSSLLRFQKLWRGSQRKITFVQWQLCRNQFVSLVTLQQMKTVTCLQKLTECQQPTFQQLVR